MVCGSLLLTVAIAALVTLTTRVTAMLDVFGGCCDRFHRWVDPDRVGLLLALTIRCIPLMVGIVRDVTRGEKGAWGWFLAPRDGGARGRPSVAVGRRDGRCAHRARRRRLIAPMRAHASSRSVIVGSY